MTIKFKIIKYTIDKKNIESSFSINLNYNNINYDYILKTPLNPILDIEILKLYDLNFIKIISKLDEIIRNNAYSYKTISSLNKFMDWLNTIINQNKNYL